MRPLIAAVLASLAAGTAAAQTMAIRDARVVTGAGAALEKGTVLVKDGRIAAVQAILSTGVSLRNAGLSRRGADDRFSSSAFPAP